MRQKDGYLVVYITLIYTQNIV